MSDLVVQGDLTPSLFLQGVAPDNTTAFVGNIKVRSTPNVDDLWVDSTNHLLKRCTATSPYTWVSVEGAGAVIIVFDKGANILNPGVINAIVWRADLASTVTAVKGYRVGGAGATINARRNGAALHLAADLSLTTSDVWVDGGAVQNTAYVVGDKLEIMVTSVAGTPTQVAVLVQFTSP